MTMAAPHSEPKMLADRIGTESVSILIETANLAVADLANLTRCLESLAAQTHPIGCVEEVLVLDAGDVGSAQLSEVCAKFSFVGVRQLRAGTGYGDVKALSAHEAAGEIIVLCDADCTYEPDWLEELLRAFADPEVSLVGGETTTPIASPYELAVALTFVFPRFSGESELTPSLWYWANNLAVRKHAFLSVPLPSGLPIQRGQNIVHAARLSHAGVVVWRAPRARAFHHVPTPSELIYEYMRFGADTVAVAALVDDRGGRTYRRGAEPAPRRIGRAAHFLQRARTVFAEEPRRVIMIPVAAPVLVVCVTAYVAGMGSAWLRRLRARWLHP